MHGKIMKQTGTSLREINNLHNRKALSDALRSYLDNGDISSISIRNICGKAGLSTSSFYNLYDSLKSFITEYLITDFTAFNTAYESAHPEITQFDSIAKITDIYMRYAYYSEKKGYTMIYEFFSSFVDAFSYLTFEKGGNSEQSDMSRRVQNYLIEAQQHGLINSRFETRIISENLYYMISGVIANWCISRGKMHFISFIKSQLTSYFKPDVLENYYDFFVNHMDL